MRKTKNNFIVIVILAGIFVATSFGVNSQPAFPLQVCACNVLKVGSKEYIPYEGVNPFYVRFDGYGNGKYVYAILAKDPIKEKVILLIVSPKDCNKWIIQSKAAIIGIDDFGWCHEIDVFPKKSVNQILSYYKDKKIKALGEGVFLSPGETDGFLVYWNGSDWTMSSTDVGL